MSFGFIILTTILFIIGIEKIIGNHYVYNNNYSKEEKPLLIA